MRTELGTYFFVISKPRLLLMVKAGTSKLEGSGWLKSIFIEIQTKYNNSKNRRLPRRSDCIHSCSHSANVWNLLLLPRQPL